MRAVAVGLHVHNKEGEHFLGTRWARREGWRCGVREANDAGTHTAAT